MGSVVSCFGLRMGVRTNSVESWPRIVARLPIGSGQLPGRSASSVYSLWVAPPSPRRGVQPMSVLYRNSARLARSSNLEDILVRFESELRSTAAAWSPRHTFLRTAGLRVGDRAVLVARPDSSRQDLLVDALMRRGVTRIARDFSPLDRQARLTPCLSRRAAAGDARVAVCEALPVDLVVLPAAVESDPPRFERLGPALATVELVSAVVTVAGSVEARLNLLATLARRAVVVRSFYSDPTQAGDEVLRLLASRESSS